MVVSASLIGCLVYFGGGALLHQVILPEPGPAPADYPHTGQVIDNRFAGERIVITRSRHDTHGHAIQLHLTLEPQGAIPAAHVHPSLDERFTVLSGALMMRLGRETHTLQAGDSVFVPRGTRHLPYNPFDTQAQVQVDISPPGNMDLCLAQLHGYLNDADTPRSAARTFLQMLVMAETCDLYLARPPVAVQKVGVFLLSPTARLLGHRSFDPRYSAPPPPQDDHEDP